MSPNLDFYQRVACGGGYPAGMSKKLYSFPLALPLCLTTNGSGYEDAFAAGQ